MTDAPGKTVDPRVRRTRQLLQQALAKLMETRAFESLSVQDITEAATLNRATFYDHYPDKYKLLECMAAARFHELLSARGVKFDGTCTSALKAMVLGVCDYLEGMPVLACEPQRPPEPHLESAIVAVVRGMLLEGFEQHGSGTPTSPEMIASAVSWAIYGAAKEWLRTPNRSASERAADTVMMLVTPIFNAGTPAGSAALT